MNIENLKKTGVNTPAVNIVRKNVSLATAISKTVQDNRRDNTYNAAGDKTINIDNFGNFYNISAKRSKRNSDAKAVLKLLPDIALSKQILVSCILSPKDMMATELRFLPPSDIFEPELNNIILDEIKEYFENVYDINKLLPVILEEALFDKGSYPVAVIPESAIDELINGDKVLSTESFRSFVSSDSKTFKPLGVLGSPKEKADSERKNIGLENYSVKPKTEMLENSLTYDWKTVNSSVEDDKRYSTEDFIAVTDNYSILKLPQLAKSMVAASLDDVYSKHSSSKLKISLEDFDLSKMNDRDLEKLINRDRQHKFQQIVSVKSQHELNRKTIGEPLIMKLPSESVIPVHAPGDVRNQICFFVLLDQDGNPIEQPDGDHDFSALSSASANNVASGIVNRVSANFSNGNGNFSFDNTNQQHITEATRIYGKMVEKDLLSRLKNGIMNSNYEISSNDEIYRLMLSRALARKFTQILMLPADYVTYIAFDYTDDGVGKSLLDDAMTINTLRVILMFTDMIGQIKNAVGRTKVDVNIPANDPNPIKTVEHLQDEIVRMRTVNLPLSGVANPNDVTEFIQRAGYEFQFSGNTLLPDLKVEFDQVNNNYQKSDDTLNDNLKNASISALGLTPEIVNNGLDQPEFATTIVANNILLSKRIATHQDKFTPMMSDHIRKVVRNSENLIKKLKESIENNVEDIKLKIEDILDAETINRLDDDFKNKILISRAFNELITGLYVELPRPDSVTLDKQIEDLGAYSDGLDRVLDAYISEDLFTETTVGEISMQVNTIRAQIKAYYQRKYLSDKGLYTEVSDLTAVGSDGKALLNLPEIVQSHLSQLTKSGLATLMVMQNFLEKSDAVVKNNIGELNEEEVSASSGGSSSSSSSDGGGSDDFGLGGLDDVGDDGLGGGDSLNDDETSTNSNPEDENSNKDDKSKDDKDGGGFTEPNTDLDA